jgi:hypothetical protein
MWHTWVHCETLCCTINSSSKWPCDIWILNALDSILYLISRKTLAVRTPKIRLFTANIIIPMCTGTKYNGYARLELSEIGTWYPNTIGTITRLIYSTATSYTTPRASVFYPVSWPIMHIHISHNQDRPGTWLTIWRPGQPNNLSPPGNDIL